MHAVTGGGAVRVKTLQAIAIVLFITETSSTHNEDNEWIRVHKKIIIIVPAWTDESTKIQNNVNRKNRKMCTSIVIIGFLRTRFIYECTNKM